MLEWITGAHRSVNMDDELINEPPETPAHLFAVKAFRTALWGTPAPYTTQKDRKSQFSAMPTKIAEVVEDEPNEQNQNNETNSPLPSPRHADPFASPTKGILMTPGASAAKKKTVSFGGLAKDVGDKSKAVKPGQESEQLQDSRPSTADFERKVKEDLRRSLFQSKAKAFAVEEETTQGFNGGQIKSNPDLTLKPPKEKSNGNEPIEKRADQSPDVTIDLQSPRSRSGKHWKHEYQRDHDNSKAEMKKLIHYSQVAKSFAEKRDGDALRFTEKWKNAEAKVKDMETKISNLATQLMDVQLQEERQAELINEVASQTAKALKYKKKAEKYRLALYNENPVLDNTDDEVETRIDKACQRENELVSLRSEVSHLQIAAERAENRASEVEKENIVLKQTLARVKEEMKKFEVRNKEREERRKRREEKATAQKKELEKAIEQANAQNATLQQELESLRSANADPAIDRIQHMRKRLRGLEHSQLEDVAGSQNLEPVISPAPKENSSYASQSHPARRRLRRHDSVFDLATSPTDPQNDLLPEKSPSPHQTSADPNGSSLQQSSDIWTATLPEPTQANNKSPTSASTSIPRRTNRALSPLISHNASPNLNPNPSQSHVSSKHPTPAPVSVPNADTSNLGSLGRQTERLPSTSTARSSSLGTRSSLPPDRAAAARRRVEERMAERRASKESGQGGAVKERGMGKENLKPGSP